MPNKYRNPRDCECGFSTVWMSAWSVHKRTCRVAAGSTEIDLRERVQSLEQQLQAKDEQMQAQNEQMREQMRAKDKQIEELLRQNKRPRTENNTTVNQNFNVNVFGKETLQHITDAKLQELLSDPETSVARLVTLKHQPVENRNVRVPNIRDKRIEVLRERDGTPTWETHTKQDILAELVESNALLLEGHADEDTTTGKRYVEWHEKLLESTDQKGRIYRDQLDRTHRALADLGRGGS